MNNLDPPIKRLVEELNKIPAVTTNSSCAGHKDQKVGVLEFRSK